jgi:hypothetical protein
VPGANRRYPPFSCSPGREIHLPWRFPGQPGSRYETFGISNSRAKPLRYIVFTVQEKVSHIVDFLAGSPFFHPELLLRSSRAMRKREARLITLKCCGSGKIRRKLLQADFFLREKEMNVVVHPERDDFNHAVFKDLNMWHLTDSDRDV